MTKEKNIKTPQFCKLRNTIKYNPRIKEKSEGKFENILKYMTKKIHILKTS